MTVCRAFWPIVRADRRKESMDTLAEVLRDERLSGSFHYPSQLRASRRLRDWTPGTPGGQVESLNARTASMLARLGIVAMGGR